MPFPNSQTHPTGQANPFEARAWSVLPATPAWDAAPEIAVVQGFWWCRLYFAYQRQHDTLGTLDYYYDTSPFSIAALAGDSAQQWFHGTLYVPGKLTPCEIVHSWAQQEFISYCATSADIETFVSPPIHLGGSTERLRVFCREGVATLVPGWAEVTAVFYAEG